MWRNRRAQLTSVVEATKLLSWALFRGRPRLVCTTTPEPFPAHMVLAAVRKTIPVRAGNGNGLVHQADRVVPGFCLQFILCQVGSGWQEDNTQQQPGLCTDCTVGNFNKVKGNQTPSLAMLLAFFPLVKV